MIAAQAVGRSGKVYAFEPDPGNLWLLKQNVKLNGFSNIHVVGKAVSEREGKAILYYGKEPSFHSLFQTPDVFTGYKRLIECISIDDYLKGQAVDVIKMDIEGGEIYALKGASKTITRSNKLTMFVEFNPKCLRAAGVESAELLAYLWRMGFEVLLIEETLKRLIPTKGLETNQIVGITENSQNGYMNLYCVKERGLVQ